MCHDLDFSGSWTRSRPPPSRWWRRRRDRARRRCSSTGAPHAPSRRPGCLSTSLIGTETSCGPRSQPPWLTSWRGSRSGRLSVDRAGSPSSAVAALIGLLDGDHPATAVLIVDNVELVGDDEAIMTSLALFLSSLPRLAARGAVVAEDTQAAHRPASSPGSAGRGALHRAPVLGRGSRTDAERTGVVPDGGGGHGGRRPGQWLGGGAPAHGAGGALHRQAQAGSPVGRVGDGDLFFADYVRNEVLAAEPDAIVELLLDTCVVTRFNSALASALTGRPDAGELLLEAESRGLFVTRLGPSEWVEVHAVLRDVLRDELSGRTPERLTTQHARAARWFEDTAEVTSALEHWILAGQPREALRLLARHTSELYDSGREATIARTISRIPLNVAMADLPAMFEFAWCHLLVDRRRFLDLVHQAGASVERLEQCKSRAGGAAASASVDRSDDCGRLGQGQSSWQPRAWGCSGRPPDRTRWAVSVGT